MGIIDKISDTAEKLGDKVADKLGHQDEPSEGQPPTGAHGGEGSKEDKPVVKTAGPLSESERIHAEGAQSPSPNLSPALDASLKVNPV
jgi:hypothetical protein